MLHVSKMAVVVTVTGMMLATVAGGGGPRTGQVWPLDKTGTEGGRRLGHVSQKQQSQPVTTAGSFAAERAGFARPAFPIFLPDCYLQLKS